ncbi:hypothetical protein K8I85_08135 [bacterium]|nr:hypothetical protein [bacterium]
MDESTTGGGADAVELMSRRAREIGHEINNCLGVITGRSELALMQLDRGNPDKARKGVQTVLDQMERMGALVDSLRTLKEDAEAASRG